MKAMRALFNSPKAINIGREYKQKVHVSVCNSIIKLPSTDMVKASLGEIRQLSVLEFVWGVQWMARSVQL